MKKSMPFDKLRTPEHTSAAVFSYRSRIVGIASALVVVFALVISCQKKFSISDECILSFQLQHADGKMFETEQVATRITADSIYVQVADGTDITRAYCKITYIGSAIWPQQNVLQDFSQPHCYTVAGEDGTTKPYVVVVSKIK